MTQSLADRIARWVNEPMDTLRIEASESDNPTIHSTREEFVGQSRGDIIRQLLAPYIDVDID